MGFGRIPASVDGFWVRHTAGIAASLRIAFGLVWLIDGAFKFWPGLVEQFPGMISPDGQPGWLQGWFAYWQAQAQSNAALIVYGTGTLELLLGIGLVLGFLRKITYGVGLVLSLLIWAVPGGFGGPYSPGTTDVGTGIVYALVFLFLMELSATRGTSPYSLDGLIERRYPGWARVAEIRRPASMPPAPPPPA